MENKKESYFNTIEFPNDLQKETFNGKENNESVLKNIALECLKKSSFNGTAEQIAEEYVKLYNSLKNKLSGCENKRQIPKQTVFDDYIICLEDGKKMQMLNRHLKVYYKMTFQQYKEKWNLPIDYPSVCKNYSKIRANIAKKKRKTY